MISWSSQKQKMVALSSVEAEYMAASDATYQLLAKKNYRSAVETKSRTTIHCDNMSAIAMTKKPVFRSQMKHIELRYFIWDLVQKHEN